MIGTSSIHLRFESNAGVPIGIVSLVAASQRSLICLHCELVYQRQARHTRTRNQCLERHYRRSGEFQQRYSQSNFNNKRQHHPSIQYSDAEKTSRETHLESALWFVNLSGRCKFKYQIKIQTTYRLPPLALFCASPFDLNPYFACSASLLLTSHDSTSVASPSLWNEWRISGTESDTGFSK